jgi:hypothetical protein
MSKAYRSTVPRHVEDIITKEWAKGTVTDKIAKKISATGFKASRGGKVGSAFVSKYALYNLKLKPRSVSKRWTKTFGNKRLVAKVVTVADNFNGVPKSQMVAEICTVPGLSEETRLFMVGQLL